jgi:hypothetical protein
MTLQNALARLSISKLLAIADKTADFTSTGFDWRAAGYEGVIGFLLYHSAGGGTTPTCAAKLEHSAVVGSGYVDVPSGSFAAIAVSDGVQLLLVETRVLKQFVRINGDLGGTTPDYWMGSSLIGFKKYQS